MRVDLATDVPDVPVSWFQQNMRVQYKRWTADMGHIEGPTEYSETGRRGIETIYFGKRPNVIRVYNKVAERQYQYSRMLARAKRNDVPVAELRTFEQIYSHTPTGCVLTRVERQIAGGRIPAQIGTFGKLRTLADYDPFDSLIYGGTGQPEPNPENYDLHEYFAGMGFRFMIERDGIHRTRQFVNKHSTRNGSRTFKRYTDFLPSNRCFTSPKDLCARFRESVSRQLAA